MSEQEEAKRKQRKVYVSVRISGARYAELNEIAHSFFSFPLSINDVLHALPRSPCCGALLLQVTRDGELTCTRCRKKYTVKEVGA